MKMSDKDLDKLFSTQLEDMEIEPSAAVWNNIKREVGGEGSTKSRYLPYLQIAAGIIVLLSVALLLRPQTEKVALHGNYTASVTASPSRTLVITPQTNIEQDMQVQDVTPVSPAMAVDHRESKKTAYTAALVNTTAVDTATTNNRPLLAGNTLTDDKPVQQQNFIEQPTPKVLNAVQASAEHTRPVKVLAVNNPPALKDNAGAKKKKIRSLGDLFNVMIAKVDKRPNKIIRFENNEDEDGDFGVADVNLGPIQIKKNN
jgi:hypothetical protein